MAKESKIQWTDATVNFWMGCKKVSQGCKYCYMFRDQMKYGRNPENVVRTSPLTFNQALKWRDPKKVFTNSWSDFFIAEADEWRSDAWDIIRKTPQHSWQILTKRPERILQCLPPDWGEGWDNVWLGVSVESQDYWDRVGILASIPAKIRFISAEPLIGPLDIEQEVDGVRVIDQIDWIILGGESGNDNGNFRYRPSEFSWYLEVIKAAKQNTRARVFMKQTGTYLSKKLGLGDRHGGDWDEWPEQLRVRDFPAPICSQEMKISA